MTIRPLALGLMLALLGPSSGQAAHTAAASKPAMARDGSHDFDWEFGEWRSDLRRKPAGSEKWLSYTGSTKVTKVLDGRANLVELIVKAPDGQIFRALNLRLYNPDSHQWSTNYANAAVGVLTTPSIGEFRNGVGEFYDQEMIGERYAIVRFVISRITPTSVHFEQSISSDGGRTWQVNWVVDDTRIGQRVKSFRRPGS